MKTYKQDNMTIHNADCMEVMKGYEDILTTKEGRRMSKPNKYGLATRETLLGFALHRDQLKKDHKELAEAAENMLELLVKAAPIDGLYYSNIDEWDCLIKEALK